MARTAGSALPAEVRIFAIQQLGGAGSPEAIAALLLALLDTDGEVVAAAVAALPDTDDSTALDALRRATEHPDPKVSAAAKARLEQLD